MAKQVFQSSPSGKRHLVCVKQPADTFATSNVDVLAPPASINGRTLVAEDRVLLTAQTDPDENGMWGFINGDLVRDFDWLNEEGQLVEIVHGSYAGRLLAFVNGTWISYQPSFSPVPTASIKTAVNAVSDNNVNLGSLPLSIGGVPLVAGNRYLLIHQTTTSENGTYVFNGSALVAAADFAPTLGDVWLVLSGTYANALYEYAAANTWKPVAVRRMLTLPTAAAVRASRELFYTQEPVYVDNLGVYRWLALAAGGQYSLDTGTEQTNIIALTGVTTGAYVLSTGQLSVQKQLLGTGSSWVTLFTIAGPPSNGDTLDVAYAIRGRYVSGGTSTFIRARALATVTNSGGTLAIAASSTTYSDARIQAVLSGTNLLIQAQQHATEDWNMQGDASLTLVRYW